MHHSVTLDKDKCKGCTACIKHCPTEAIRVRRGKATIIDERCIDCGECIRTCPHHAKKAVCDSFGRLKEFEFNIALPAPSLYGQFHNLFDISTVLHGLLYIGFDMVYEVAKAAEMISDYARSQKEHPITPQISSACPACVRLICQRFPKLMSHISPHIAPVELAAIRARKETMEKTGLSSEKIGVFFITPCPAKMTAAHQPVGLPAPVIDGALSMTEVYLKLLPAMKKVKDEPSIQTSGLMGVGWAASGGESATLLGEKSINVDGVPNVIRVLEDIEDGKLSDISFVELGACTQGCLGGCLATENPFAARSRLKSLMKYLPVSRNHYTAEDGESLERQLPLEHTPVWQLDNDIKTAMEKYQAIELLLARLPGLDCSSCGAPSCRALAEDVVLGFAQEEDCIFHMRERMIGEDYLPPPFRK